MNAIGALKKELLERMESSGLFEGVRLLEEYPGTMREIPLTRPAISVGVHSLELAPEGLGSYYGEGQGGGAPLYGAGALVTVRFDIFAPGRGAGAGCHRLYETLCGLLMLEENAPAALGRMWCGEIAFDKAVGAWRLCAKGERRGAVTRKDASMAVQDFLVLRARSGAER